MPPKCLPNDAFSEGSNMKGVLKINSNIELGCPTNNGGIIDETCKQNIYKNNIYKNTTLGYPSKYSIPNPPNLFYAI